MIKATIVVSFIILTLGCVNGGMNKVDADSSISNDIVEEIIYAWDAKNYPPLGSINARPTQECPNLVGKYKQYVVCTGAYLVVTKYKRNMGYSAFDSYRLCTKTECTIIFGNINYGIEE